MIEESKYCSDVMKKYFNKELVMTKEENQDFKNSTKCWICDNYYIDNDLKVRDHCHIARKYRRYGHRYCNINLNLTLIWVGFLGVRCEGAGRIKSNLCLLC